MDYVACFKGTMSEVELVTMRNRLERGKLHKAERGELIAEAPCGYFKLPSGEIILDPDEQARSVVTMVFDKFDELGSFTRLSRYLRQNDIRLGMRVHRGPRRGELEWRPAIPAALHRMLHHPIYAGAYSYGRRRVDQRRTAEAGGKVRMRALPMEEWKVLLRDRLPAYITWERYLANRQRLLRNRCRAGSPGVPRAGRALLTGLLICGACGRRMSATYRSKSQAYYHCTRSKYEDSPCSGLAARAIDDLVAKHVLMALEPAALELSLRAIADVRRDRETIRRHWQQRLERAAYEALRAERQYQAVEPENRLVARGLERKWEEALRAERDLREEYHRFLKEQPPVIGAEEEARIRALSVDIASLWQAPQTTPRTAKRSCACSLSGSQSISAPEVSSPAWRSRGVAARRPGMKSPARSPVTSRWATTIGCRPELSDCAGRGERWWRSQPSSTGKVIARHDLRRATRRPRCGN